MPRRAREHASATGATAVQYERVAVAGAACVHPVGQTPQRAAIRRRVQGEIGDGICICFMYLLELLSIV